MMGAGAGAWSDERAIEPLSTWEDDWRRWVKDFRASLKRTSREAR
jgi:hypothetical protein